MTLCHLDFPSIAFWNYFLILSWYLPSQAIVLRLSACFFCLHDDLLVCDQNPVITHCSLHSWPAFNLKISTMKKKKIIQLSCSKEGCSFWSSGLCNFLCWSVISFVMVQHSWKPFAFCTDVFSTKGFLIEQSRWPARLEGLICFDHSILYYKLLNWHPSPNPSCCHLHTMVLGVELNYPRERPPPCFTCIEAVLPVAMVLLHEL